MEATRSLKRLSNHIPCLKETTEDPGGLRMVQQEFEKSANVEKPNDKEITVDKKLEENNAYTHTSWESGRKQTYFST